MLAANASCERCHRAIAAEWRGSPHAAAYTDPIFQAQLAREPLPFCVACHAPESDPAKGVRPADADATHRLGVGCVSCHVVEGHVLAGDGAGAPAAATRACAPHDVTRVASFDDDWGCGGCHQFRFPEQRAVSGALMMQSTVAEHRASRFADRSCGSCHAPRVDESGGRSHRDHRFAVADRPALLRAAVRVEAQREADGSLRFTLIPGEVGHAFPTGDMLRRLVLELTIVDADGRAVESQARALARHFGFERTQYTPLRRVELRDDRVGDAPREVRLRPHKLPPGGSARFSLRWERVSAPEGGPDGGAIVADAVTVAEGALALP